MRRILFGLLAGAVLISSCQTGRKEKAIEKSIPPESQSTLSKQLTNNLVSMYGGWRDLELQIILKELTQKFFKHNSDLKQAFSTQPPIQFEFLSTRESILAPGLNSVMYFSRGLFQSIEYENELAFVLAFQLSLLKQNLMTLRMSLSNQALLARGWFDQGGLYDFGYAPYLKAESDAIKLVYLTQFDPRGAITFLQRWNTTHMSKVLSKQEDLVTLARNEVAKLSPQQNPIVKTNLFQKFHARLRRLSDANKPRQNPH